MTICPEERCTGCGACQSACPADCIALALNRAGDRVAVIDESRCTRCGKCKQVCSMCYPERSMQYHPRNKNMVLGMLLEAVYYSQVNKGAIDDNLLRWLRDLVEHCTCLLYTSPSPRDTR